MLTEFSIKNFRALEDVKLTNLARVNLIGGKNGVGKTSVLEALWVFAVPTRPDIGYRIADFRDFGAFSPSSVFLDLFYDLDKNAKISLRGKGDQPASSKSLSISLREDSGAIEPIGNGAQTDQDVLSAAPRALSSNWIVFDYSNDAGNRFETFGVWAEQASMLPNYPVPGTNRGVFIFPRHESKIPPTQFLSPNLKVTPSEIADRFGQLQMQRRDQEALAFVKAVGPLVENLVAIKLGDEVVLHAELQGQRTLMPVKMLGEGGFKALEFALAVSSNPNGTVLIDEIENGLHHSIMGSVFRRLFDLAEENNVQVFATTHSWECVKAAHDALGPIGHRFAYHRIGTRKGKARSVHYDDDMLQVAFETGWDIR